MTFRLSIEAFGCIGDGVKDNTDQLNYALLVAKQLGPEVSLLAPPGVFAYSDILNNEGVLLAGVGDESVLWSLNTERAAIYLRGQGARVHSLRLSGIRPAERSSPYECGRVVAYLASDWEVHDVSIETGSTTGITSVQATRGRIIGNRVSNTLADAIHLTDTSSHIEVAHNTVRNPGDDCIAVVSYLANGGVVHHVHAHHNDLADSKHGRGMSVVGGSDVLYEQNLVAGINAAGLYIAQEDAWATYGCSKVVTRHNTLVNCGNADIDHPAILVFSDGNEPNDDIAVERTVVSQDGELDGLRVYGDCTNVRLDANVIATTGRMLRIDSDDVAVSPYTGGPVGKAT